MKLPVKTAVVAGGAGGVGEGIVRTLLKEGVTVIVPGRTATKLQKLREYVADITNGQLVTLDYNIGTEEGARAVQAYITQNVKQGVDLVVASLGSWWQGEPITSIDMGTWSRLLTNNLTTHFLAIKYLVPLLKPQSGSYVHINGFSAEQAYPMAAPVAMAAAAQKSLVMSLAEEVKPLGLKVYELILGPIQTRDRIRHGWGRPDWYFPEEVGSYIFALVQGETLTGNNLFHKLINKTDE